MEDIDYELEFRSACRMALRLEGENDALRNQIEQLRRTTYVRRVNERRSATEWLELASQARRLALSIGEMKTPVIYATDIRSDWRKYAIYQRAMARYHRRMARWGKARMERTWDTTD